MGGINHQPCKNYLGESTRLSRFISLARANFEFANVALEDIILAEMSGQKASTGPMRHQLQLCQDHLLGAVHITNELEGKMHALNYVDLPPLHEIDLIAVGRTLVAKGMVNPAAWTRMSGLMKERTFYGNLALIRDHLGILLKLTQDLLSGVVQLGDHADDGNLQLVVDENRAGNIKEPFARLYVTWGDFHEMFLASSLVSTEVWYAHMSFGSLTTGPRKMIPAEQAAS
jgi:hypothetical protein